jgi:hypothetical protein
VDSSNVIRRPESVGVLSAVSFRNHTVAFCSSSKNLR